MVTTYKYSSNHITHLVRLPPTLLSLSPFLPLSLLSSFPSSSLPSFLPPPSLPPPSLLSILFSQFDTHEDPHLLQQASLWLKKLRESYPTRHYTVGALMK